MNPGLEQTLERLAIDVGIRDLAARFSDAVNRRDPDAFGDLFTDDGAWEIGEPFPSRAAGRPNVTTMFTNLRAPWARRSPRKSEAGSPASAQPWAA